MTYPDGMVQAIDYTARNQVATMSVDGPPPLASFTYDPAGNRLSKTLENGTVTTSTYDISGLLTGLTHANGGNGFESVGYGYNSLDLRTNETRNAVVTTFSYDSADQLASATYGTSGNVVQYSYDSAGNRTLVQDAQNGNTSYSASPPNQYFQAGHDGAGNISYYASRIYSHRPDGRLFESKYRPDPESSYTSYGQRRYDGHNRIIKQTFDQGTFQIFDGWNLIAEYTKDLLVAEYVHGPEVDEILVKMDSSEPVYYHRDGLGSTIALTDAAGTPIERYTYDAYGWPSIQTGTGAFRSATAYGNRFLFTGREWLARTNIYDYRNRTYFPVLGRFGQPDPIGYAGGDLNLYRYVANNPVNWVDSFGLYAIMVCNRCEGGSGEMRCITYESGDGAESSDPFSTNEGTNDGNTPAGNYTIEPKPESQMEPGNEGMTGDGSCGKITGPSGTEYPQGTPSITGPSGIPGNPGPGWANNNRIHGPGYSKGCITTNQCGQIKDIMDRNPGEFELEINDVCCEPGEGPPDPDPIRRAL